jgi:hypothetical protein
MLSLQPHILFKFYGKDVYWPTDGPGGRCAWGDFQDRVIPESRL